MDLEWWEQADGVDATTRELAPFRDQHMCGHAEEEVVVVVVVVVVVDDDNENFVEFVVVFVVVATPAWLAPLFVGEVKLRRTVA